MPETVLSIFLHEDALRPNNYRCYSYTHFTNKEQCWALGFTKHPESGALQAFPCFSHAPLVYELCLCWDWEGVG